MRVVKNQQMQIGEVDISTIKFNPKSRDDIPQVLMGLQYIYVNTSVREEVFSLLIKNFSPETNKNNGRPGMEIWSILVMGVLRLNLNIDYDRLHELVNEHRTIREILGHGFFDEYYEYNLQTIKDNVRLLTPELLDNINMIVVKSGHALVKKKEDGELMCRADSFVVETHVHFPTDISLLFDATRKVISLISDLCNKYGLTDWRQSEYNIRLIKRLMRSAQNKKRSKAKDEDKKTEREALIVEAHQVYIDTAQGYVVKAIATLLVLEPTIISNPQDAKTIEEINRFIKDSERQISQIKRRIIIGESIPHDEKVFSIFQPHTEWISKGKAGVPVELGLRVCVLEDQYQFILHHIVMEKQTDDQVAVLIIREAKSKFPDLHSCSFDKGFHSPENQKILNDELEFLVLPRKGKLSKQAQEIEQSEEFRKAKKQHSAIESAINALEIHGLDVCPDNGIHGFKRYCALAIVARNIQRIGAILKKQHDMERIKNKKHLDTYKKVA